MNEAFRRPLLYIMVISVFVLLIGVPIFSSYEQRHTITTVICDKDSVSTDDGHEYRVYTLDGTFGVKDHVVNGTRFRSADTFGLLQEDTVYKIEYYGWRNGPLSLFPNIIKATKVANEHTKPC